MAIRNYGYSRAALARRVSEILADLPLLAALDAARGRINLTAILPEFLNDRAAISTADLGARIHATYPLAFPASPTAWLLALARAGSPYAGRGDEEEHEDGPIFRRWLWLLPVTKP